MPFQLLPPCSLASGLAALLALHGLQTRDVLAHFSELVRLHGLASCTLQAQCDLLLAQADQLGGQIRARLGPKFVRFHQRTCRFTKVVATDSLAPARRNASRACTSGTPSISNRTLPGCTLATQYS